MKVTDKSPYSILVAVSKATADLLSINATTFKVLGVDFQVENIPEFKPASADMDIAWLRMGPTNTEAVNLHGVPAWELAHQLKNCLLAEGITVSHIDPACAASAAVYYDPQKVAEQQEAMQSCKWVGQKDDRPKGATFAWHLNDDYSQLKKAREAAGMGLGVRIAHIDTGYDPKHSTLPENFRPDLGWNFHKGQRSTIDEYWYVPPFSFGGHGTGTLSLLAGNKINTHGFNDYLGGAPLAEVIPLVPSPTVISSPNPWVENYAHCIHRAIDLNCDVISMSMGGTPWKSIADAAQRAYNAGIVLVAAGGNFFCGIPPLITCPALYTTTVAAGGGMADYHHYDCQSGQYGASYDPAIMRQTMVSGYSPNVPWAVRDCGNLVNHNGDGTSSSTPQVAAAAALWLKVNKDNYPKNGIRVEACLRALRQSAHVGAGATRDRMGAGLIRAFDALSITPNEADLKLVDFTDQKLFEPAHTLPGFAELSALEQGMLECELAQVSSLIPIGEKLDKEDLQRIVQQPQLSESLKTICLK